MGSTRKSIKSSHRGTINDDYDDENVGDVSALEALDSGADWCRRCCRLFTLVLALASCFLSFITLTSCDFLQYTNPLDNNNNDDDGRRQLYFTHNEISSFQQIDTENLTENLDDIAEGNLSTEENINGVTTDVKDGWTEFWDSTSSSTVDTAEPASRRLSTTKSFGIFRYSENPSTMTCYSYPNDIPHELKAAQVGAITASIASGIGTLMLIVEFFCIRFYCSRILMVLCFIIAAMFSPIQFALFTSDKCRDFTSTIYMCSLGAAGIYALVNLSCYFVTAFLLCILPQSMPLLRVIKQIDRHSENDPCWCCCDGNKNNNNDHQQEPNEDQTSPAPNQPEKPKGSFWIPTYKKSPPPPPSPNDPEMDRLLSVQPPTNQIMDHHHDATTAGAAAVGSVRFYEYFHAEDEDRGDVVQQKYEKAYGRWLSSEEQYETILQRFRQECVALEIDNWRKKLKQLKKEEDEHQQQAKRKKNKKTLASRTTKTTSPKPKHHHILHKDGVDATTKSLLVSSMPTPQERKRQQMVSFQNEHSGDDNDDDDDSDGEDEELKRIFAMLVTLRARCDQDKRVIQRIEMDMDQLLQLPQEEDDEDEDQYYNEGIGGGSPSSTTSTTDVSLEDASKKKQQEEQNGDFSNNQDDPESMVAAQSSISSHNKRFKNWMGALEFKKKRPDSPSPSSPTQVPTNTNVNNTSSNTDTSIIPVPASFNAPKSLTTSNVSSGSVYFDPENLTNDEDDDQDG